MAKTEARITLYAEKVERLIKKGLIVEADIIDTAVKSEYTKRKK
jgi:hypothetical protein